MAGQARQRAIEHEIFEAEQSRELAFVAAEGAREMTQIRVAGVVARTDSTLIAVDAEGIVANGIFELQRLAGVLS